MLLRLEGFPEELKKTYTLSVLRSYPDAFDLICGRAEVVDDKFVLLALKYNIDLIRRLTPKAANKYLYEVALEQPTILTKITQTDDVYKETLAHLYVERRQVRKYFSQLLLKSGVFYLLVVRIKPQEYKTISLSMQQNLDIAVEAVTRELSLARNLSGKIRRSRGFWIRAVKADVDVLGYIPDGLVFNYEIIKELVFVNPKAFEYLEGFDNSKGRVLRLLKEGVSPKILEYSVVNWEEDREICMVAAISHCLKSKREQFDIGTELFIHTEIPLALRGPKKNEKGGGEWKRFIERDLVQFVYSLDEETLYGKEFEEMLMYSGLRDEDSEGEVKEKFTASVIEVIQMFGQRIEQEACYIGTPRDPKERTLFYARIKELLGRVELLITKDMVVERVQIISAASRCGGAWEGELVSLVNILESGTPVTFDQKIAGVFSKHSEEFIERAKERFVEGQEEEDYIEDVHIANMHRYLLEPFLVGMPTGKDSIASNLYDTSYLAIYKQFFCHSSPRNLVASIKEEMRADEMFREAVWTAAKETQFTDFRMGLNKRDRDQAFSAYYLEKQQQFEQVQKYAQLSRSIQCKIGFLNEALQKRVYNLLGHNFREFTVFKMTLERMLQKEEEYIKPAQNLVQYLQAHYRQIHPVVMLEIDLCSVRGMRREELYRYSKEQFLALLRAPQLKEEFDIEYDYERFLEEITEDETGELKDITVAKVLERNGFLKR